MKKITLKLTRNQLDEKIEKILKMKELVKQLNEDIKETQTLVESNFELTADQKEILEGNKYSAEKRPKNNGKNCLDYEKAALLLKPEELKLVQKTIIDVDKLKAFIKAKAIDECLIPMIREDNWTYTTHFKHIECTSEEKPKIKKSKAMA